MIEAHFIYSLAWLSFGLGHSVLASAKVKNLLASNLGAYYRLSYNLFAGLHISAVWLIGYWVFKEMPAFGLSFGLQNGLNVTSFIGLVILILALRTYDLGRFAGTQQIRNHRKGDSNEMIEPLRLDGMHAYVRHPLYLGAYLLLWGRAQDDFGVATAIWGSIYLAIGSKFEERRLIALYGKAYQEYLQKVPAIIPWRGKVIDT